MALLCRTEDWATAASEPRCRCVYLHHGPELFDPPNTRMWRDDLTITAQSKRAPPRVVLCFLCSRPTRHRHMRRGDRPGAAVAAGRDRRNGRPRRAVDEGAPWREVTFG
jgi:hypothetical protein